MWVNILAPCFATFVMLVSFMAFSSTMKMKAACSAEMTVGFQRQTRYYIQEDVTVWKCVGSTSHRKKYKCLETWNQASDTSTVWKTTTCKRGMEGLDKGGQGPISGCCVIEEEEEEEEEEVQQRNFYALGCSRCSNRGFIIALHIALSPAFRQLL
jgi:hypothetical protein